MLIELHLEGIKQSMPPALHLPKMTDAQFYRFCQRNPDYQAERDAKGNIYLMSPSESWTDSRNSEIVTDLVIWNRSLSEPGMAFGPSAGFILPNGATRSPDTSWIAPERWAALNATDRARFARICPDFMVELMSPSDRLTDARAKMEEYRANGARLGWLIDRQKRQVYVYRPGQEVQVLDDPTEVSVAPELPGFVLRMDRVF